VNDRDVRDRLYADDRDFYVHSRLDDYAPLLILPINQIKSRFILSNSSLLISPREYLFLRISRGGPFTYGAVLILSESISQGFLLKLTG